MYIFEKMRRIGNGNYINYFLRFVGRIDSDGYWNSESLSTCNTVAIDEIGGRNEQLILN